MTLILTSFNQYTVYIYLIKCFLSLKTVQHSIKIVLFFKNISVTFWAAGVYRPPSKKSVWLNFQSCWNVLTTNMLDVVNTVVVQKVDNDSTRFIFIEGNGSYDCDKCFCPYQTALLASSLCSQTSIFVSSPSTNDIGLLETILLLQTEPHTSTMTVLFNRLL